MSVRTNPRHALIGAGSVALLAAGLIGTAAVPASAATTATTGNPKVTADYADGGESLRPGDSLVSNARNDYLFGAGFSGLPSTRSGHLLLVQDDGNVVEYERSSSSTSQRAVWASGTAGVATPTRLTFQTDGNVVLYDARGVAQWSTGTAGRPAQYFAVYGNGQVVTQDANGQVLAAVGPTTVPLPGFVVDSATGAGNGGDYDVRVQGDGNVVAYRYDEATSTTRSYWSTGTAGAGPVRLVAQSDGNLVVYRLSDGRAIWQSGSRGPTGYYQLDAQADGNVVLYRTDGRTRLGAIWASGTRA